ncbi:MAG TPA: hypothetical protein VL547_09220 [Dinghuibacter sp.]|uniref:hypothetical protein n=1 Tax=Dinghuibacter sp. TaxID=2024697 RepID=UPI002C20CDDC|nr:hypothetical protein [Dinghuibacter sp.]HTJ12194.1 hypothetical protein [Dinghuibacter sp.]
MTATKQRLKAWAEAFIQERVAAARAAMDEAQAAANSEEKSSAGDKYETGRAMGHLQKELHARQLTEALGDLATLHAVPTQAMTACTLGALVETAQARLFISIGLGKQVVDGEPVIFLSPMAPLAKQLMGKRPGEGPVVGVS